MNPPRQTDPKSRESATSPEPSSFPLGEVVITASYLLVAVVWVVVSDLVVDVLTGDPVESLALQTTKGLNFVLATALLLYVVLRRSNSRRRRAEAVARESAERFELVARASNDAIWDWNLVTDALWWGAGLTALFGYEKDEVEPTIESWVARLHPDDRERVVRGIRRAIDGGSRVWIDEYRFRRKDGTHARVFDKGFVIRGADGKPVRMVGGIMDVTEQRAADDRVRQSRQQLRALSARLQSLREEEQKRIAREIHDELGQLLTALKMDLRWIENRLGDLSAVPAANPILDRVVGATEMVDQTIGAVQKIAGELRPAVLDSLGLVAALKQEGGRFQERTGIQHELRLPEQQPALTPEAITAVFRIFQEALTNVTRHANATRVKSELRIEDGRVVLGVSDNGKGLDESALAQPESLGLLGMQERATIVGGDIVFGSSAGKGTTLTLRVPLAGVQPGAAS